MNTNEQYGVRDRPGQEGDLAQKDGTNSFELKSGKVPSNQQELYHFNHDAANSGSTSNVVPQDVAVLTSSAYQQTAFQPIPVSSESINGDTSNNIS